MSVYPDFFNHLWFVNFTMESTDMKEVLYMEMKRPVKMPKTYFIRSIGKDAMVTAGGPPGLDFYHMMRFTSTASKTPLWATC